jgi:hypothetical protein
LSSAILYLAIVAIWAVVLVPRWLRARSAQPEPAVQPGLQPATPEPADPAPPDAAWQERADPAPVDGPAQEAGEEDPGELAMSASPSPAEQHASVLQARRWMLGALVALTAGAAGFFVTGIAALWVIIPPAVMLVGYLVLLREAAHADAERARRATRVRYATVAPMAGQEPESFPEEPEASPSQVPAAASGLAAGLPSGADVIDISGRISDQVYDQYSDAEERAVGD